MAPDALLQPFGNGQRGLGEAPPGAFRFPIRTGTVLAEGPGVVHCVASHSGALPGGIRPGQTCRFQAWYRDPGGPCGASSHFSNALEILFVP